MRKTGNHPGFLSCWWSTSDGSDETFHLLVKGFEVPSLSSQFQELFVNSVGVVLVRRDSDHLIIDPLIEILLRELDLWKVDRVILVTLIPSDAVKDSVHFAPHCPTKVSGCVGHRRSPFLITTLSQN